ncbi:DegT/DnrJ/EryC1/StrS family aminotransferase [Cribrihabitans pelagius]|uniref:DegT/DnrJ/EryC1/StrS family aminotransferase n=1 Tax=Cribrihabitans pelagius TaxID=1765746 RepID=UPI003B5B8D15
MDNQLQKGRAAARPPVAEPTEAMRGAAAPPAALGVAGPPAAVEIPAAPVISPAQARRLSAAVLGGTPAFRRTLHVGRPNMPDQQVFLDRIQQVLGSGQLTNWGPLVQDFEARVAEIAGARHCIATCNATTGLELAIGGLGMAGDVIVPSFTFIATVHALWRQGVRPVFCDIDPVTHCLDPDCVEAAITSRTTGILGVHLWGNSCASERLRELAREHGLKLMFDAAHAFGCQPERPQDSYLGDAEVYSFHATKCIHAFEGGAIVTNDDALADRLRYMVNFGFAGEDQVAHLGTNGKMNEASAAMGLTSVEAMDRFFGHNRENYAAFAEGLAGLPGLSLMPRAAARRHSYQYVVTEIDPDAAGLTRDELVAALRLENVVARRYFHPGCHRMQPYAGLSPRAGQTLPVTEAVAERVMVLPTGTQISREDVARMCARITALLRQAPEVRAALKHCEDPRLPHFAPLRAGHH